MGFINNMNLKIMKLLESSTKDLHTLTDINPQSCLTDYTNDTKDPIEDAFAHLRSLLTFQTALKKSALNLSTNQNLPLLSQFTPPNNGIVDMNANFISQTSASTFTQPSMSSRSTNKRDNSKSGKSGNKKSFRSTSREVKKSSRGGQKIYSQLMSGRNSKAQGTMHMFLISC